MLLSLGAHALAIALLLRLGASAVPPDLSEQPIELVLPPSAAAAATEPRSAERPPDPAAAPPPAAPDLAAASAPPPTAPPGPDPLPPPSPAMASVVAAPLLPGPAAAAATVPEPTAVSLPIPDAAAVIAPPQAQRAVAPGSRPVIRRHAPPPIQQAESGPPLAAPQPAQPTSTRSLDAPSRVEAQQASHAATATPSWSGQVAAWLASHKHYPEAARQNGEEGAVAVRFVVARDGRVEAVTIARSSGVSALDEAVGDMLRGQRVPPFPPDMAGSETEVGVTIRFALDR